MSQPAQIRHLLAYFDSIGPEIKRIAEAVGAVDDLHVEHRGGQPVAELERKEKLMIEAKARLESGESRANIARSMGMTAAALKSRLWRMK